MATFNVTVKLAKYEAQTLQVNADSEAAAKKHIADLPADALLRTLGFPAGPIEGDRQVLDVKPV